MKILKKVIYTAATVFALLGIGGVTAFAAGYIQWGGTADYNKTISNLEAIQDKGRALKDVIKDKNKAIADKERQVEEKENIIAEKEKEIENLKNSSSSNNSKLKQAEADMKAVKEKSQEVLNDLDD